MLQERLSALQDALAPAFAERATLLLNHLIAAEPAALERLRPHAGSRLEIRLEGAPAWWRQPPLVFEVTPAGLLDLDLAPADEASRLAVTVDVSHPLALARRVASGERPGVRIDGDAAFAADVHWLIANLRWDVEDDLERLVGPAAAHGLARAGAQAGAAARSVLETLRSLASRG